MDCAHGCVPPPRGRPGRTRPAQPVPPRPARAAARSDPPGIRRTRERVMFAMHEPNGGQEGAEGLCGGSGREWGEVSCQASLAASPRHGQTWSPALEGRKIRDGGSAVHHRTARTMISSSKRPADPPPGSNPRSWLSCCHPVTRRQTMSTRCQHNVIRHCASARSKMRCRAPRDQLFGE